MSNIRQRKVAGESTTSLKNESSGSTNGHTHSHKPTLSVSSLASHSHTHGDDSDEEHTGEAMMLLEALKGRGDAGSRVTLLGLGANIGLTVLKGVAGWYLKSAALIADAGHSLSDLIADMVTLCTVILSQRPPSSLYPLGFGKFESLGTVTMSFFLLLGGIGIGAHSWGALSDALSSTLASNPNLPPVLLRILALLASSTTVDGSDHHGHSHSHHSSSSDDEDALSPSAIFFPLFGILVKEYLYRVTKRVAEEQNSSVLMANALHHRSDAFSSIVTIVAILGSIVLKGVPVDPLGGIIVALLILQSSIKIFKGAVFELTDASVSSSTLQTYKSILHRAQPSSILTTSNIRAVRSGSSVFVDMEVVVQKGLSGAQVFSALESLKEKLQTERKEVREVRTSFRISE
ncbi:hypothetical protein FRC20_011652 [Serendipita sp. 405]|nr:hypothetical protein FRC15_011689 [Serendipita sp. 397]KAG8877286.1 hypothetical protein FRC20_011652 [Serendipita sp. 405]